MDKTLFFHITNISLRVGGILPIKRDGDSLFSKLTYYLHRVYCFLLVSYFSVFVCTQVYEVRNVIGTNLMNIVTNLGVTILYSICLLKLKILKSPYMGVLFDEIQFQEAKILTGNNAKLKEIYMRYVTTNYKLNKFFLSLGVVTILPFFVAPFLELREYSKLHINDTREYQHKPLIFSSWFPFDKYKYYHLSFGLQLLAGTIGATMVCVTDILFYGLLIYGLGQVKLLQYCFRNYTIFAKELQTSKQNCSQEEAVVLTFGEFVDFHKKIIKYIEDLDRAMRFLMLLDFCCTTWQMAMIGFQMIVVGVGWKLLFLIEYIASMIIQLFLFYWFANEIILESQLVSAAIWESDWISLPNSVKQSLLIIMLRAHKPLTLSVGPFYVMSTQTALSIMRASYSYLALLNQVYKD